MHHVDAYVEYHNIVGDDDGGTPFTEKEFEDYKKKVLEKRKNRIYVSWICTKTGEECKVIGPQSKCFCNHTYRQHSTDDKKMNCRQLGCKCSKYDYVPSHGTWAIRCSCKHEVDQHEVHGKKNCKKSQCKCQGFYSPMSCGCGVKWADHKTLFETREERISRGMPVDNLANGGQLYQALGGITNYKSLVGNYLNISEGEG